MSASATPAMRQCLDAKQLHRDAILLFRMGDFYEMFYEDALVASRALELTLTVALEGRQRRRHPDVRRAVSRGRRLHHPPRQEGIPRRHLRPGRGSAQGQGHRQARSRPRRLAGDADRRELPRRPRAGVPDGDRDDGCAAETVDEWRANAAERSGARSARDCRRRAARSLDRRLQRHGILRRRRTAGARRRARSAPEAARDRRTPARNGPGGRRAREPTARRCRRSASTDCR